MQLLGIGVQLIRIVLQALGGVIGKQRFFQPVEAGEFRVVGFLLVVIFTGIDAAVQIGEQLGNRFDTLVVLAGRRVELARLIQLAGFDGIGEQFGLLYQPFHFFGHVNLVLGDRPHQIQHVGFRGGGTTAGGHHQFTLGVAEQAAGHIVFARFQVGGHFLGKARRDILTLFHHHHPFEDFPLQVFLAGVGDHKLRFARRHGDLHRFTLFIIYCDLNLRNVCGQRVERR
ncbi:hypothetical protein HAT94_04061 [Dickeya solani]|nr:hypothetical protein [Dickeya solani]